MPIVTLPGGEVRDAILTLVGLAQRHARRIRFVEVPEISQRVYGLRAGDFDFACDLPPDQIASNHAFADLAELWLGGDRSSAALAIDGNPETGWGVFERFGLHRFDALLQAQVALAEPLDDVLAHMSTHHIGSALVTTDGHLAGIFTVTDACRAFCRFLRASADSNAHV